MKKIVNGIIAGFIATVVLSILMLIKKAMGLMPELNPITDLTNLANEMGLPNLLLTGWVLHFVIGTLLWGTLFGILSMMLPGMANWLRGILLGIIAWLIMMLWFMPKIGLGLFATEAGPQIAMMTLVLHLVFGLVMGVVYGGLEKA